MKSIWVIVAAGAALAWAATCLVAVDETEYVIIKRLGDPRRIVLEAGLQFKLPSPIDMAVRFDSRLQVYEYPAPDGAKEYLTRDKKNVEVGTFAAWRIDRAAVLRFLETVGDRVGAETRLGDIIAAEVGAELGGSEFEKVISIGGQRRWGEIGEAIHRRCAERAREAFGIDIVDLRIVRMTFPPQNRRSVFDRMRAERERIATQYRSEGEEEALRIRAEAERDQERILAEAGAKAEQVRGQADAEAARIYGEAYSVDPEFYRFVRTLESYQKSIDADTVLILPGESEFFRLLTRPDAALEQLSAPAAAEGSRQ